MNTGFWSTLKRFVLWDYPRTSWQYEVKVGLILVFIFFTPAGFFNDKPRPKNIQLLSSSAQESSFLIEPDLLAHVGGLDRDREAERLIQSQAGNKNRKLNRVEAISPDGKEVRFFVAYTKP